MSEQNVQIVKRALDAFSHGDAAGFASLTTPDLDHEQATRVAGL